MACPCCFPCTCETSWLPREGNLTSITLSVKRLNCSGYTISETLSIPQESPNPQQILSVSKLQQNSNECVSGPHLATGLGAASILISFRRCPLELFLTFRDYYQLDIRLLQGFVTPWARCDASFLGGNGVDNSKPYFPIAGFNAGSRAGVWLSSFFKTESGILWSSITGPWCNSIKTEQDSLELTSSVTIPQSSASDPCAVTKRNAQGRPHPAVTIDYETKLTLRFNMLP
jgi:hypothetical protein